MPRPSRRTILKRTSAAALAAPCVITSAWADDKPAPSNRLNVAFVGLGAAGLTHFKTLLNDPTVQIVSLCDLEDARWESATALGSKAYSEQSKTGRFQAIEPMLDFRQICNSPSVDAVYVCTPDHWHALVAVAAIKGGKDVFCESSLTLTIDEGKRILTAARRYNRLVQVNHPLHADPACRRAVSALRNGRLGELRSVTIGLPAITPDVGLQPEQPVPRGFDYDTWLGPAPWAPYTRPRTHTTWRYISDYAGGEITDRGSHLVDLALRAAEPFLKGPITIESKNGAFYTNSLFDTATRYNVTFTYANNITLTLTSFRPRGIRFDGADAWIDLAIPDDGQPTATASDAALLDAPRPAPLNLHTDLFTSIPTRGPLASPADPAHRAATLCHLANLSLRLDRKLTWDPAKENFVNDDLANRHLSRPYRAPWRLV